MARSYNVYLKDPDGRPIYMAKCEAIDMTTKVVDETEYTDADGLAAFTSLDDDHDYHIKCFWPGNVVWFHSIFGQYVSIQDIDDTPVDGVTTAPISSNWAYDHAAAADPHSGYIQEAVLTEQGDIIYASGASTPAALAHGNAGNLLQSGGHGGNPSWVDHTGAADPHTGYRLESADHSHQATGMQAGQLDHGLALTGLTDDDHTQYILKSTLTEQGDLFYASAVSTPAALPHGNTGQVLQSGGHGANPSWLTVDDTAGGTNGSIAPVTSNVVYDHTQAADPHTGYRLESADHNHQSTGAQAGKLDHGAALDGLTDDDHLIYILKSTFAAIGEIIYANGASLPVALPPGNAGDFLASGGVGDIPFWAAHDSIDTGTHGAGTDTLLAYTKGTPEQGNILYYDGSNWVQLTHGTSSQYLKSGGHGANPSWGTPAGGTGGGVTYFVASITSAANAGDVTVATVTDAPVVLTSAIIHADAAQTADLTSCGLFAGASKVITIIPAAKATQANLDAADKQVSWAAADGGVRLAVGKTIVIALAGTGATAVDLTVTIGYNPESSGGTLA